VIFIFQGHILSTIGDALNEALVCSFKIRRARSPHIGKLSVKFISFLESLMQYGVSIWVLVRLIDEGTKLEGPCNLPDPLDITKL
jgi:hypothetical protein